MKTGTLILAAVVLSCCVYGNARTQSLVVPLANTTTNGNDAGGTFLPFSTSSETYQVDYAASQFTTLAAGTSLTSLGFRLASGSSTGPTSAGIFSTYQITLSKSNNSLASLSTTFASNIGSDAVQVYNQSLTIASNAFIGGSGPNPFFYIPFTTPYTYTGGDLLLTVRYAGNAPTLGIDGNDLGDGKANTVANSGSTSSTGIAGFFNYPIVSLGTSALATPEPDPLAFLIGMIIPGVGFLAHCRRKAQKAR